MWIFLNDAFVSIVMDENRGANLLVRARRQGDLEAFLGADSSVTRLCPIVITSKGDYRYRISLPRRLVMEIVRKRLMNIEYINFKDSVDDDERHSWYLKVWYVMAQMQEALLRRRRKAKTAA